ncbi:PfkB family carbohydrate kinase [Sphingobacterium spiritivorum]|uniref:PfkB family carbohydrate kinase n=1 Tax=Sphingobacterium spiritivorum TaxID=258 RepID=UPI003DA6165A
MIDQDFQGAGKGKVLSFGELLLRICPDGNGMWLAENKLPFYIGGAELNVATALALWDVPSSYLTAVPDHAIAHDIVNSVSGIGVDMDPVLFSGDRFGIYYLPKGKDLKNASVIYDRANSSYAELKTGDIDWNKAFEGVSWFHFSAICPAISQDIADICLQAVKAASEKGITVSLDLNYRSKLWKYGKEPLEILPELVPYCTLIMGNVWAANKMLGTTLHNSLTENGEYERDILLEQATETSKEIIAAYPNCKAVANTFRFDYGQGIRYYTTLFTQGELTVSREYISTQILDKVGSGDCFMAGLIYGFYHQLPAKETLAFATAAAYDKLFIPSDATTSSVADVLKMKTQNEQ